MKLKIEINLDNAAFEDNPEEVTRLLEIVSKWYGWNQVGKSEGKYKLLDFCGNACGLAEVTK